MQQRSYQKELLDLGPDHYTPEEYADCMKKLGQVGRWLGGDRLSVQAIQRLDFEPQSILDVGCGGGDFTAALAKRYPAATVRGIDLNRDAILYARTHHEHENLEFVHEPLAEQEATWQISIATLMTHHLTDEELIHLLQQMIERTTHRVLLNDLHRHRLPYLFFRASAPLLFRNRLITQDGALSIKRGFVRSDWNRYFQALEIAEEAYSIQWSPLFRWIVEVRCDLLNSRS